MAVNELDLTTPSIYTHWTDDIIRFADLDRVGHVNNVAFATYSESGRVDFLEHVTPGSTGGHGTGWVIAKLTVNFLTAAYYPGKVRIGNVVRKIGNSSIVVDQGLFSNDKCFGTCETVLVWADTENEKSVPLPDEMKSVLTEYLLNE
jgi:acyl-CoA thioester hydrolase